MSDTIKGIIKGIIGVAFLIASALAFSYVVFTKDTINWVIAGLLAASVVVGIILGVSFILSAAYDCTS